MARLMAKRAMSIATAATETTTSTVAAATEMTPTTIAASALATITSLSASRSGSRVSIRRMPPAHATAAIPAIAIRSGERTILSALPPPNRADGAATVRPVIRDMLLSAYECG